MKSTYLRIGAFFIGYAVNTLALAMGSVKRVRKRKAYPNGLVRKHDTKCDPGMAAIVFAVAVLVR